MSNKENNVISHFLTVGAGVFINMLLGLITTPLITRIVDPAEYGQFTIFNTYLSIVLAFVFFGLDSTIIRFFYDSEKLADQKSLLKFCLLIPVFVSLITLLVFVLLMKLDLIPSKFNEYVYYLLFVDTIISIWNKLSTAILRLTYQSKMYSICTILEKLVYVLVIIFAFIFIKQKYFLVLVVASISSYLIPTIVRTIKTKKYWKLKDVRLPINKNELYKYSLPVMAYNLVFALFDATDKMMADKYFSEFDVGIYSSALTIVGLFALIQITFEAIWSPIQTEHFVNNPDDTSFISKGNRYITIIMFFVGINVILFKDVLCYLLGSGYREAAKYIPFLIFNPIMYTLSFSTVSGIDKSKKSYLNTIISIITLVCCYLLNKVLIPLMGLTGIALSTGLSFTILFILKTYFSVKYYYVDYGIKKLIIITLITFGFAYIGTFYKFGVVTIIGYIISLTVFVVLYFKDMKEMLSFFTSSLIKKK